MKKIDIKNHEKPVSFKAMWLLDQFNMIRKMIPESEVSNEEIKKYLLGVYDRRKIINGRLYSNVTKKNIPMSIEAYINKFLNEPSIMTGYCVLMKDQDHSDKSVAIDAVKYLLDERSVAKKEMLKYDMGSADYLFYNVRQLVLKILANSYYGINSMGTSTFYNSFMQNAITGCGQDLISAAIYMVESFVSNNEHFQEFDEIIEYVTNITDEVYDISHINIHKTKDEVKEYIKSISTFEVDETSLERLLGNCSQETLDKVYYKNQLIELIKNDYYKTKAINLDEKLDMELLSDIVNICHYNYISPYRFMRVSTQSRRGSVACDTDSTFVYLDRLYNEIKGITGISNDEYNKNVINFLIGVMTEAIKRTMETFTHNCGIPDTYRPIINMKNESSLYRLL